VPERASDLLRADFALTVDRGDERREREARR
jgi:hypothetical protein